jgi:hypothetical protein
MEDREKNMNEENEVEPKCGEEWGKIRGRIKLVKGRT